VDVTKPKNDLPIRRILVALDVSAHSQAALEAAASVAALLDAELVGMFVEDINLLRVAQLPFVQEVCFPSAEARDIGVPQMERHWRSQATEARRQLGELVAERRVKWSFRVVRGPVSDKLLTAALDMDLLALGRLGRSLSRRTKLGSTARRAIYEGKGSVLLMRAGVDLRKPILAIFDGSDASYSALDVAAALAHNSGHLRILIWTDDHDQAQVFKGEIVDQLQDQEIEISFRRFYPHEKDKLVETFQKLEIGLLVFGTSDSHLASLLTQPMLELLDVPVLVIRQPVKG
jgi:nucleotide-binding universal stress UspA family protein